MLLVYLHSLSNTRFIFINEVKHVASFNPPYVLIFCLISNISSLMQSFVYHNKCDLYAYIEPTLVLGTSTFLAFIYILYCSQLYIGYIEPVMVILHEKELTCAGRISWKHHTCMISALSISTSLKQHPLIWSATVCSELDL